MSLGRSGKVLDIEWKKFFKYHVMNQRVIFGFYLHKQFAVTSELPAPLGEIQAKSVLTWRFQWNWNGAERHIEEWDGSMHDPITHKIPIPWHRCWKDYRQVEMFQVAKGKALC